MPTKMPHPTPWETILSPEQPVEPFRNVHCRHYDTCLDFAVKQNWDGWTCAACPLLHEEDTKPVPIDFANDRRGWGE